MRNSIFATNNESWYETYWVVVWRSLVKASEANFYLCTSCHRLTTTDLDWYFRQLNNDKRFVEITTYEA